MSEELDIQDREARDAAAKAADYEHGWSADIETEFAEKGLTEAMVRLGDIHRNGALGQRDYAQAMEWWTRAAKKFDPVGQLRLTHAYMRGVGVPQDYQQAYVWASLAALQGNEEAAGYPEKLVSRLRPDEQQNAERVLDEQIAQRMIGDIPPAS